jgi:3-oxoacyl-[acyl-carrier-protein] synthase-1
MATAELAITGIGMVSTLGIKVNTACAAARAGITRACDHPHAEIYDSESAELFPVTAHALIDLCDGYVGVARLLRMLQPAFEQLPMGNLSATQGILPGIFIAVASGYHLEHLEEQENEELKAQGVNLDEDEPTDADILKGICEEELLPSLSTLSGIKFDAKNQGVIFGDQVGVIDAVRTASEALSTKSVDVCIAGGVDSYVEPMVLQALADCGLLKGPDNPEGISPGEAAALVQLELPDRARARRAPILGYLHGAHCEVEDLKRFTGPSQGRGLSKAIRQSIADSLTESAPPGLMIGSLNGDPWRAHEWGVALLGLPQHISAAPLWNPAESFGELGAASGAVAICMGVRGLCRGYAGTQSILIWQSNEDGRKGAIVLKGT